MGNVSRRTLILPFLNALELMSSYANQTWNILQIKQKHTIEKDDHLYFFLYFLCFCLIDTELQKGFNVFRTIDFEMFLLPLFCKSFSITSFNLLGLPLLNTNTMHIHVKLYINQNSSHFLGSESIFCYHRVSKN